MKLNQIDVPPNFRDITHKEIDFSEFTSFEIHPVLKDRLFDFLICAPTDAEGWMLYGRSQNGRILELHQFDTLKTSGPALFEAMFRSWID